MRRGGTKVELQSGVVVVRCDGGPARWRSGAMVHLGGDNCS
jgi:hypothetical protein